MMAVPGLWGRCSMAILLGCCGRVGFDPQASPDEVGGDGAPLDSGLTAPVLLFQPDYQSSLANGGQPGANRNGVSEAYTIGIYRDPQDDRTKLLVNDRVNNRVLIYDHVPHQSGELPDVVVGQVDFTSGLPNAGDATPN